jgi:hypothetical protein
MIVEELRLPLHLEDDFYFYALEREVPGQIDPVKMVICAGNRVKRDIGLG